MSDHFQNIKSEAINMATGEIQDEEIKVLSVSDLNGLIKRSMEEQFALVWLKAEISNFKPHSSGHFYFSLKDSKSQISAVMFRGYNTKLNFKPQDGVEVLVRGRISVYEPRGNYQILVEKMEVVGAGSLQKAFEDLKKKLNAEGLFDIAHKKPLPKLPKKIALITSPTGAAVRDMIQVLGRRYKAAEILLIPSLTQGEGAAQSLMKSVELLPKLNCDVAIIGRGGGSIEDLWCFNDEGLARALYQCQTPIVSAVGHEIDFTICDFVCDLRAPTPSAAAEIVSQYVDVIFEEIKNKENALSYYLKNQVSRLRSEVRLISQKLVDPKKKLQDLRLKCDDQIYKITSVVTQQIRIKKMQTQNLKQRLLLTKDFVADLQSQLKNISTRLRPSFKQLFKNKQQAFMGFVELLDSLNPLSILHRGFSITRKNSMQGQIVKDNKDVKINDELWLGFSKGSVKAKVITIEENKSWEQKKKQL